MLVIGCKHYLTDAATDEEAIDYRSIVSVFVVN